MDAKLDNQEDTGRDEKTGRFLPGHTGNPKGRPKALDLRRIAEERAAEEGVDLGTALWSVVKALLRRAIGEGDVQAAKLLMDRLCEPEEIRVKADLTHTSLTTYPEPSGEELRRQLKQMGWRPTTAADG